MTRHIIATALATALIYLIGAFIAWDLTWVTHGSAKDRADVVMLWATLVAAVNVFTLAMWP